jgi:hypothetical protein
MLSASVMYPLRGAAAWKSTFGANVASDALANLASGGVTGGTMIIVGEDYGGRLLYHGAHSCLRDEIADVAARSASRP